MMTSRNTDLALRARADQHLSLAEMRDRLPAIFAEQPHESRSSRYIYIPTVEVVEMLIKAGFQPVEARVSRTRTPDKQAFTKHLIRFRPEDGLDLSNRYRPGRQVGDTTFELVLRNAHDGTAAYDFMAGLFRLACLNGMVLKDKDFAEIHVRHSGNREHILQDVLEGAQEVLKMAPLALEAPRKWSAIQLSRDEQTAFAEAARTVRFGDAEGKVETPIQAKQLLIPRRHADIGQDLWKTFNVVQENAIRGGLSAQSEKRYGRYQKPRTVTTREVKAIDTDIKLNKALWTLADTLAKIKTGEPTPAVQTNVIDAEYVEVA